MMTTVEGIYRDGKVELTETLPDVQESRVLITFLTNGSGETPPKPGQMIRFGMFPQLQTLTDEDFKAAEFHGDPDDRLDWG